MRRLYTADRRKVKPINGKRHYAPGGFLGSGMIGGAAEGLDTPMGEYKRGLYDAADPLYHLAGKNKSVVGEGLSDAGVGIFKASAQSGNLAGMAVGGVVKGIGSLVNAAFGTNVDREKLNRTNRGTNYLANFNSRADAFGDVKNVASVGNVENAYSGGWFRKGWANRRNRKLWQERAYATNHAYSDLDNNIDNLSDEQTRMGLRSYFAFGGPLEQVYDDSGMGAIGYGLMSDYLTMKNNQATSKGISAGSPAYKAFAEGGNIEIKHPGRLTELKKRTGKTEAELWAEGKPEVRKMITFARNSRRWKKALGGNLGTNGRYSVGQVVEVSEEEANRLKQLGYEFRIVG